MRHYDNWLKAYVQHTRYSESPDSFHFWTGVATIAGALRRRVWIDQRIFQWTPNFYIILVGPPGIAAKSTSIRSGLGLLERTNCGIHFGPQSVTWQALMEALQNAHEVVEFEDHNEPMSCLTVGVSELGTFFRPDNKEMVDFLVAMWDGQKEVMRRQTKTQGAMVIHNPWLNVIGCTTPAWLKDNFPDVLIGGGLTSRMVFVFGDKKRQLVAYPADLVTSEDFSQEEEYLIQDLQHIALLKGEYALTPAAKAWGMAWYEELWTGKRPEHLAGDKFAGYLARKQTMLHKLAIVLAAAKRPELAIDVEEMQEANQLLTLTEHDLRKVFQSIGVAPAAKINGEVLSIIRTQRKILYEDLYRTCYVTISQRDFIDAIKAAVQANYIRIDKIEGKDYVTYTGPLLS
jgi:hypothetical protein